MSEQWQPVTIGRTSTEVSAQGAAKALEDDDPYALMAMPFPVPEGVDPDRELARCLIEEYALMGWGPDRIRELFATDLHGKVYDIHQRRGAGFVDELIKEVWG